MRFCSVHWSGVFWLLLLGLGRKWGFFRHEIWPFLSFVWLWNCWVLIGILVTFPFTLCMISLSRSSLTEEFFFSHKRRFFLFEIRRCRKKSDWYYYLQCKYGDAYILLDSFCMDSWNLAVVLFWIEIKGELTWNQGIE